MASISLKELNKSYGALTVVHDIDLEIADKEFIILVGPSGCGKSTTLRMIAGLEEISGGELKIGGDVMNDVPSKDRDIAMVFQNYALYPHMTVYKNMAFGLQLRKVSRDFIDAQVQDAARILDISHLLNRKPKALSGGQRQRVALGRAMVRNPAVFLLDEPLSNLDAKLRGTMRSEITKLHKRLNATFIYVTHDQVEAMTMASRIVVLNQGNIEQVGSPLELYRNPDNLFVAGFLGAPRMNFLSVTVDDVSGQEVRVSAPGLAPVTVSLAKPAALQKGASLTLGVRPENISVVQDGSSTGVISGTIRLVEHLGRETILYVDAGNLRTVASESGTGNITVQLSYVAPFKADQTVTLKLDPSELYLFASDGGHTISVRKTILDK